MPKVAGLSAAERKALLQDQMADDGAEPIDLPAAPEPSPYAPLVPEVKAAAAPTDMAALVQMLAAALGQSGAATAQAITEAMGQQAHMARNPIAETYLTGGYPGKSVFSHPDGDLVTPRTELKCPIYMGVYNDEGKVIPVREIDGKQCTEAERVYMNQIAPGRYEVQRNDGQSAFWRVVESRDDLGELMKITIAVPQQWMARDQFHAMPPMVEKHRRTGQVNPDGAGFLTQLVSGASSASA